MVTSKSKKQMSKEEQKRKEKKNAHKRRRKKRAHKRRRKKNAQKRWRKKIAHKRREEEEEEQEEEEEKQKGSSSNRVKECSEGGAGEARKAEVQEDVKDRKDTKKKMRVTKKRPMEIDDWGIANIYLVHAVTGKRIRAYLLAKGDFKKSQVVQVSQQESRKHHQLTEKLKTEALEKMKTMHFQGLKAWASKRKAELLG